MWLAAIIPLLHVQGRCDAHRINVSNRNSLVRVIWNLSLCCLRLASSPDGLVDLTVEKAGLLSLALNAVEHKTVLSGCRLERIDDTIDMILRYTHFLGDLHL